jgi:hypothetical protein
MHHVDRGAGHAFCKADHAAEAQILGELIVHLGQVLKPDPPLGDQLGVHVHHQVVVLGMDDAEPLMPSQDLEDLPDVAELDHAALPARQDVCGEYLHRGVAGLDRLGEFAHVVRRRIGRGHQMIGPVA